MVFFTQLQLSSPTLANLATLVTLAAVLSKVSQSGDAVLIKRGIDSSDAQIRFPKNNSICEQKHLAIVKCQLGYS